MNVFHANAEQSAYMEELKRYDAMVNADPRLRKVPEVIEGARERVAKAVELGLPTPAYLGLQLLVSSYDNEQMLPPHLRNITDV